MGQEAVQQKKLLIVEDEQPSTNPLREAKEEVEKEEDIDGEKNGERVRRSHREWRNRHHS